MAHILDLPREICVVIFKYLFENSSQRDFYLSVSKVCQLWDDISKECFFWKKFDGSLNRGVLLSLSINGSLVQTEELTYCFSLMLKSSKTLEKIFAGMPNLKSVNFSKVQKLQKDVLTCLLENCKKVCAIKFSEDLNFPKYIVSDDFLNDFLLLQGNALLVIDLSNLQIKNLPKIFHSIAESCSNLEEIYVQNVKCSGTGSSLFPLKLFQEKCNKLKVLRLGFPIYFSHHPLKSLPGFPMLEVFTHPNKDNWKFLDKDLVSILFNSPNLKILDIRGCHFVSANTVLSLPATHLENLYVSFTRLGETERLCEILTKWLRSLCVVDISKTKLEYINKMLFTLSSKGKMINLESLDLNNTKVNAETVIHLIENCEKLCTLNLSSCRSIGRGFMREYKSKTELNELYSKLLCRTE